MSTQFEFRLIGAAAPEGELDADQLLAIVQSLKEIATRLGRVETDAEPLGRPPKRVERVARLTIGLAPGSTRVLARRAHADGSTLDFDLAEEHSFDARFQDLVESIALDERPDWVSDSLAASAAELTGALQKAAPEVEFCVAGQVRRNFKTADVHKETWHPRAVENHPREVTYVGKLEKVDLRSQDFRIRDDLGNAYALPKVADALEAGRLIGSRVAVTGLADRDSRGRVAAIRDAVLETVPDPLGGVRIREAVPIEEILASAPGPMLEGISGLSEEEAESFFEAIGL